MTSALGNATRAQLREVEARIVTLTHERDRLSTQTARAYPTMSAQDVVAVREAMASLHRRLTLAKSQRNRLLLKLGEPEVR